MTVTALLRSISRLQKTTNSQGQPRIAFSINVEMDEEELAHFFDTIVADAAHWEEGGGMTIHFEQETGREQGG